MKEPVFKAGYLPGLHETEVTWKRLRIGNSHAPIEVDLPQLSEQQMKAMAQRIQMASHRYLKTMTVSDIVHTLSKVTARLLDRQDAYRQKLERLLPLATGFDSEMVRLNLNSYLQTFRGMQLQRFIQEDFSNPKLLDEFQARTQGGWCKAFGPELLLHIWAGNVPALPMWSLIAGLLVKAGSIGKISRSEPVFASLLAHLIAEVEPRWADCFAVVWWPSEDLAAQKVFELADVIMAYGGNEALQAMKAQAPVATRFLGHGHKLSFALVTRETLNVQKGRDTARLAALDIARYDQQGCYSPHMIYVQRGAPISPKDFAQHLFNELNNLQHKIPLRALDIEEASSVRSWREAHEFATMDSISHFVLGDESSACNVIFSDKPLTLTAGPLNRNVVVVAIDELDEIIPLIAHQREYLQTVGLAATPESLFQIGELLGGCGVTRICALGAMTSPEAGWHHDGRFSLLDLIRVVDIEASTEREADRFSSYEI